MPSMAVIPVPPPPMTFREIVAEIKERRRMQRPIVWFLLGVAAYYIYIHYVQKVPAAAAKPGNGGR